MYFSENLTLPHWIKASHEKRLYSESIIFFSVYKLQKVLECLSEASVIFILLASPSKKQTNKQKECWQGHCNSCGQLQRAVVYYYYLLFLLIRPIVFQHSRCLAT